MPRPKDWNLQSPAPLWVKCYMKLNLEVFILGFFSSYGCTEIQERALGRFDHRPCTGPSAETTDYV